MLVLAGAQGIGKTRWVASLCPVKGAVRTCVSLDPTDKDSVLRATSAFITEVGELDHTTRKADISALKAFLTEREDTLRRPYAAVEDTYPRRTGFIGTVNGTGFLADDTGSRRFWVLNATHCTPLAPDFAQQLWAEYAAAYADGARGYLDAATQAALQESNEEHQMGDPLHEAVVHRYRWELMDKSKEWPARWISPTQIFAECVGGTPSRAEATRIGNAVRKLNGGLCRRSNGIRLLAVPDERAPRSATSAT